MAFPIQRPRRLRRNELIRDLVCETQLSTKDFIYPLFIVPGVGVKKEIGALANNYHLSIDCMVEEVKEAKDLGINAFLLFGVPDAVEKDETGTASYAQKGIVQEAVRVLKSTVPDVLVITDVCPCEYTSHGHCGIMQNGYLANDLSLDLLAKITLSHAEAGADIVAPAAMLDGQIEVMRHALDSHGFENIPIMAYAAKFASKLFDPFFRHGTHSPLAFGDKRTHQMDYRNSDEAMREIAMDIEQGADIVMVKPALFYLDVVYRAKQQFHMPLAVYNVSGEYAMIEAAAQLGFLDKDAVMMEALTCLKRAGADLLITYFSKQAARLLSKSWRSETETIAQMQSNLASVRV